MLSSGVEVTKLLKNIVMLSSLGCGCVLGRGGALPGLKSGGVVEAVGEVAADVSQRPPEVLQCLDAAAGVGLVLNDPEHTPHLIATLHQLLLHLQETDNNK